MEGRPSKRKKSVQEGSSDSSTMPSIRKLVDQLQKELEQVKRADHEVAQLGEHINALQSILDNKGKKNKILFSTVQHSDLLNIGVERKLMRFNEIAIQTCSDIAKHIDALCAQINRIHHSVSRRFEAGARMTLDAVLLTLVDISLDAEEKLPVAIFPEMQIASSDGVLVKNAKNGYSVWLTGYVDYGICTYRDVRDHRNVLNYTLQELMIHIKTRVLLIEAKRDREILLDCIPEATSQAIALSEVTGNQTVRYCLSDGKDWMFLAYTCDREGNRISYEGPTLSIKEADTVLVRRLVGVLYHWLRTDGDIRNDPLCDLDVDST